MFKYIFPFVLAIVGFLGLAFIFGTFDSNQWERGAKVFFFFGWVFSSAAIFMTFYLEGE